VKLDQPRLRELNDPVLYRVTARLPARAPDGRHDPGLADDDGLPLENPGTATPLRGWLYLKDEWAKRHPIFGGHPVVERLLRNLLNQAAAVPDPPCPFWRRCMTAPDRLHELCRLRSTLEAFAVRCWPLGAARSPLERELHRRLAELKQLAAAGDYEALPRARVTAAGVVRRGWQRGGTGDAPASGGGLAPAHDGGPARRQETGPR
jgi:hypothetical protein